MSAFEAALDLGVHYLETDVHATADGTLVAFHDPRLDRVTDRRGTIARLPWAEVGRARVGANESIPRLEDVLGAFPQARVNVDIKSVRAIRPMVEVLRRTKAHDRVCIASFSAARSTVAAAQLTPRVARSGGMSEVALFWAGLRGGGVGRGAQRGVLRSIDCLQVPTRWGPMTVDERFVQAAHDLGRQVHVWTVNDPDEMRRLLRLGVDALITDRADLAQAIIRRSS